MKALKLRTPIRTPNAKQLLTISVIFLFQASAWAQKGTASPGLYPPGFNGHTFTGAVQSVDESQHHFTLTHAASIYSAETFVGALQKGYTTRSPDGTTRPLKVSDLPIGKTLTVYYMGEAKGHGWRTVHKVFLIEGYPNLNVGNTSFRSF